MCWIAKCLDGMSFFSVGLVGKGTSCRGLYCQRIVTASKLIYLHELNGFDAVIKAIVTVVVIAAASGDCLRYLGYILAIGHADGVDDTLVEVIRMTAAVTIIATRI